MAEPATKIDPIRPTDAEALRLARELCAETLAAMATVDPATGYPAVSRVTTIVEAGVPHVLVSDLSHHTRAMRSDPRCSIMLGTAPAKGDPLAFPRMTVFADASRIDRKDGEHSRLREAWLRSHPKAALYIDFADFHFWRLVPRGASLNGGFGKAFELTAADLAEAAGEPPAASAASEAEG